MPPRWWRLGLVLLASLLLSALGAARGEAAERPLPKALVPLYQKWRRIDQRDEHGQLRPHFERVVKASFLRAALHALADGAPGHHGPSALERIGRMAETGSPRMNVVTTDRGAAAVEFVGGAGDVYRVRVADTSVLDAWKRAAGLEMTAITVPPNGNPTLSKDRGRVWNRLATRVLTDEGLLKPRKAQLVGMLRRAIAQASPQQLAQIRRIAAAQDLEVIPAHDNIRFVGADRGFVVSLKDHP